MDSCKFCDMNISEFKRNIQDNDYSPSVYIEEVGGEYTLVATGDDITRIKIRRCPICDRMLK